LVVISFLFGSILLLNLLDPYSNFGKIWSDLARPFLVLINNILVKVLEKFNLFILYPVELKHIHWGTLVYPMIFLVTIVIMSVFRGRLFCNTLCPVGATLGLISKFSVYKIKIDDSACTRCGKCSSVCKAECIDVKAEIVDFTRCVGCFNCLKACSEKGIGFKLALKKNEPVIQGNRRKEFFGKIILYLGGASIIIQKLQASESGKSDKSIIQIKKNYPVSPPGSLSIENFIKRCTACHLCVSTCPTYVLQPSFLQYGWVGIMQPFMDYSQSFCNYECIKCSEVCPTGAIMKLSAERKKTTQIGTVNFIKKNCIVYTKDTACGACSEHCPTKAVQMISYKGALTIPATNIDICIGCGACEYACPASPNKAIYVDGNKIHKVAKKPEMIKSKEEIIKDFPF
jgi:ferredoxin